jgi:sulfate transport system substrate-binding protein
MSIKLTTIDDFGGWDNAYKLYFDDGGLFDEIYNE